MYKVLFVKSSFKNLYEIVGDECKVLKEKGEMYIRTTKGKNIKIKSNKITEIKDDIICVFDNDSLFILGR